MGAARTRAAVAGRPARRATRTALAIVTGLAGMGVVAACEPADCTTTWVATSRAAWHDPAAWDTASVPTGDDVACIGVGAEVDVTGASSASVTGLKLASTLHIGAGATVTIAHSQIQGAPTARVQLDGGSITLKGGTGNLTLDGGELHGRGDVYASVTGATGIAPGNPDLASSTGVLTIHGDLALDQTYVPIDLAGNGNGAGLGHDRIAVTGALSVTESTLIDILPGVGFLPVAASTFSVFTAASRTGNPSVQGVPDYLDTGKYMVVDLAPAGLDLLVTHCDPSIYGPYTTYTTSQAGKDLRLCQLYTTNFTGVNLTGADLRRTILWDADLTSTNLTAVNLAGAEIGGATLTGATLTGLRSGGIVGSPAALPAGAKVVGGYLVGPGVDLSGVDLTGLDLSGVNLAGAKLGGSTLTSANLAGVRSGSIIGTPAALPTGWRVVGGYLAGPNADLTGANLSAANLANLNLAGANLTGANLTSASVANTNFASATLGGVRSGSVVGTPAALPNPWQLRGGFLVGPGADLSAKTLSGTDLRGVDLHGANLTNTTLSGAMLGNANLAGATLTGARGTNLAFGDLSAGSAPAGVLNGFLIGPGVNLAGVTISNLDLHARPYSLAGANLTNTSISSSDLFALSLVGANLTGTAIVDSKVSQVDMTGANMGGRPVGASFGQNLTFTAGFPTMTPPAGWAVVATGLFGTPPYRLQRVS